MGCVKDIRPKTCRQGQRADNLALFGPRNNMRPDHPIEVAGGRGEAILAEDLAANPPFLDVMARTSLTTGYARLTPRQARAVLAAAAVTMALAVAVTLSPLASSNDIPRANDSNDVALYRAEAIASTRAKATIRPRPPNCLPAAIPPGACSTGVRRCRCG